MRFSLRKILHYRSIKITLEILFILIVVFAVKTWIQRDLAQGIAPPVTEPLLDGQNIDLKSLSGKPVLLYFWATWCPVCKMQQSSINNISKDHAVVSIAMNSGTKQDIQRYLQKYNLDFPVIADEAGEIARRYGVSGVPTSFVINPSGNIAFTEVGYTTEWGLRLRLWLSTD